jgi:flavin-dependent dehydrogenase
MRAFDVLVVGGGPGGSTAARFLRKAGLSVGVLDRASFPRVKLCAGWLSRPVWDALEIRPDDYPRGLWAWERCHVHFGGRAHAIRARGYFIRRYEFDDYLLSTSGAEVVKHPVKTIDRDGDDYVIDGAYRARYLVGAGGTHCPVARALFPRKPRRPVGAQELEFEHPIDAIASYRAGGDGEPELLLHSDLRGYSWNIPKSGWLNVGTGTMDAKAVRTAWADARAAFLDAGHLPPDAERALDRAKGHSYYLFDPAHLDDAADGNALLVGDALGLAQPLTAEGILPAILSGRMAAEAIVDGDPASYPDRLRGHEVLRDYELIYRLREAGASLRGKGGGPGLPRPKAIDRLGQAAVAHGFAWLFSGRPLPGGPIKSLFGRR